MRVFRCGFGEPYLGGTCEEVPVSALSSITEQDLRRLLDVVSPEAVSSDGPEMPEQVLLGLAELIPSACVSFFVMDARRRQVHAMQEVLLADLPPDDGELDELFFDAYWDSTCSWPERSGDHERVTMDSDFSGDPELSGRLMAEYMRLVGAGPELLLCMPPRGGSERRILLSRERGDTAYTERDRLLLTLLRPHLIRLRDQVEAQRRTVPALTPRQLQLLRRVADGHTNRRIARDFGLSEATVRKHLEHIYARLEVNSRTEALARMRHILAS
jgi:DNA-binding CsgD family transcriptional regulator